MKPSTLYFSFDDFHDKTSRRLIKSSKRIVGKLKLNLSFKRSSRVLYWHRRYFSEKKKWYNRKLND